MTQRRYTREIIGLAMLAVLGLAMAFSSVTVRAQATDEETAEVEAFIAAMVDAFNEGDFDTFRAFFTDQGLIEFVDDSEVVTVAEAEEALTEFLGQFPVEIVEVRDIEVDDDTASAIIELIFDDTFESIDRLELERDGDSWIVTGYATGVEQPAPPEIPAGYETIPVELRDYEFGIDLSQIAVGDRIAFEAENVGEEPHELVFIKVPADLDLEAALAGDEPPPGVVDIAFTFTLPGQTGVAIAEDPIAAGRYVMVCFVETADGEPHFTLGMLEDFTIAAPATSTPTAAATATPTRQAPAPPATGSGAIESDSSTGLVVLGLVLAALSLGGGYAVRSLVKR